MYCEILKRFESLETFLFLPFTHVIFTAFAAHMANMRRLFGFQFAFPFQPLLLIRQHYHDFLVVNRARCDAVEEFSAVTAKD